MKNKPKSSFPWYFVFIPSLFPIYEKIFPKKAGKFALSLFLTPFKFEPRPKELAFLNTVEEGAYIFNNRKLKYIVKGEGKSIILYHGWNSRPSHLYKLANALVASGYKIYAITAPGHGTDNAKRSSLVQFSEALACFVEQLQIDAYAIVGHSLGGAASLKTIVDGKILPKKMVSIATPSIGQSIIDVFKAKINGGTAVDNAIRNYSLQKFSKNFDEFSAAHFAQKLPNNLDYLIVHDNFDKEAPIENAQAIQTAFPSANTFFTNHLGHNRLLKDEKVIQRITSFLSNPQ